MAEIRELISAAAAARAAVPVASPAEMAQDAVILRAAVEVPARLLVEREELPLVTEEAGQAE